MQKTVFGVFDDRFDAEAAMSDLEKVGYNPKDISIVMRDREKIKEFADDTGVDVAGGTVSGAATGGFIGGLAGLVASFVIPGLGAFFIGGPIAAALGLTGAAATAATGAATGAVAGGFIGALVGFGVSEEDARVYESRINEGAILLAVPAKSGEEIEVTDILEENGATNVRAVSSDDERMYTEESMQYGAMGAKGGRTRRAVDEEERL